jgi:hypothetical protein
MGDPERALGVAATDRLRLSDRRIISASIAKGTRILCMRPARAGEVRQRFPNAESGRSAGTSDIMNTPSFWDASAMFRLPPVLRMSSAWGSLRAALWGCSRRHGRCGIMGQVTCQAPSRVWIRVPAAAWRECVRYLGAGAIPSWWRAEPSYGSNSTFQVGRSGLEVGLPPCCWVPRMPRSNNLWTGGRRRPWIRR